MNPDRGSSWRLRAAGSLAWALWLGGWIGLASLSQAVSASACGAFAQMALGLFALGAIAQSGGRPDWPRAGRRGMSIVAAAALALAVTGAPGRNDAGGSWLILAWLAWAAIVGLASATVRGCRRAAPAAMTSPATPAAAGAVLAWICLGDVTDLHGLTLRLAGGVLVAGGGLAALQPPRALRAAACLDGLFDCSLPSGSSDDWRDPQRRPVWLASLVMLPMMCTLPLVLALCRSGGLSPRWALGLHLAAMFVPAWLVQRRGDLVATPAACGLLLALGAAMPWFVSGGAATWGSTLLHGAAWSLAWTVRIRQRPVERPRAGSTWTGWALSGLWVLAIGAGLDVFGGPALGGWQLALGLAGGAAALCAWPAVRRRVAQ